jgi:hypothetical protein
MDEPPPDVSSQPVGAFVEALGSTAPAPGAGAAGALALALAAGCAAKAFALSARHTGEPALTAAAERARDIARVAIAGAARDEADFRKLLHARDDSYAQSRVLRFDGEALLALAADLRHLLEAHGTGVIPSLAADLGAALALTRAFEDIQRRNLAELS